MKAVPAVLCYLSKCTASFSLNCVHTLSNSGPMKAAPSVADKCIAVFSWNCAQTSLNQKDSTPVCETGRKATKVGGWLQLLSYTSVNKLKLWLTQLQIHDKFLKLNFHVKLDHTQYQSILPLYYIYLEQYSHSELLQTLPLQ